ncbi:hypothetical protein [Calycomorphotria hydatis]|uniref:Carboxypeptidase regulatory-like domain-containing protein n=1 Tax=Calycomorphotria hydatis TaxID=2528027 RepID=A0A517T4N0_9PLAN|nr:hypothetical protein [Calycomorphotria hydatis]QDT63330.1 hypothetical protein V22_05500 [Calycomorphotria hydatis]
MKIVPYFLLCVAAALIGCNTSDAPSYPKVTGSVTIDGQSATKGVVSFTPVNGGDSGVGIIQPDGSYQVRTSVSSPGIPAGDYRVAVTIWEKEPGELLEDGSFAEGVPAIPEKYFNNETSGLSFTVSETGTNHFEIEISAGE